MAPSVCGHFVTDKRSLIAFTWTLTCVLTWMAFIACATYLIHIHTTYIRLEHSYYDQWYSNYLSYQQEQQQNNNNDGEDQQQQQQHSADKEYDAFSFTLNSMRSGSMTLIALYILMMTTALTCYGSTAIVGFTSLRGIYMAPCFSSHDPATLSWKLGMFGGAIVLFANLLLICAVILGEVRVRVFVLCVCCIVCVCVCCIVCGGSGSGSGSGVVLSLVFNDSCFCLVKGSI